MPFSEYAKSLKAARMLNAQAAMQSLRIVAYPNYSESDRKKYFRELQHSCVEFMEARVKDYREVLGNLTRRLMKNG